jgi:hypothetical protein
LRRQVLLNCGGGGANDDNADDDNNKCGDDDDDDDNDNDGAQEGPTLSTASFLLVGVSCGSSDVCGVVERSLHTLTPE